MTMKYKQKTHQSEGLELKKETGSSCILPDVYYIITQCSRENTSNV